MPAIVNSNNVFLGSNGGGSVNYTAGKYIDISENIISVSGLEPYSAGQNIDITDNVISGKNWTTDINNASSYAYEQATAHGVEYSAGDNIDITNHVISGKDWTNEIENATTGKLDATAFNSGDFYPMTGNPSGFLTAHQSLTDYYTKNETSSKQEISAALSGLTAETIDLSAGEGISIVETANKVVISCTATGAGFDPTYISAQIDNKLDKSETANYYTKTEIQNQSGNYYPMTGNPSGFLTSHQSLSNYYTKNETSSKQQISAALANAGHEYTGIAPIGVNNSTYQISAETWSLSAGDGLRITEDAIQKVATIEITGQQGGGSNVHWYIDTPNEHTSADIDLTIQTTATLGGGYDRYLMNGTAFIGELIPSADTQTDAGKFLTVTAGSPRWGELPSASFGIKTEVVANSGLATANGVLYIVTGN